MANGSDPHRRWRSTCLRRLSSLRPSPRGPVSNTASHYSMVRSGHASRSICDSRRRDYSCQRCQMQRRAALMQSSVRNHACRQTAKNHAVLLSREDSIIAVRGKPRTRHSLGHNIAEVVAPSEAHPWLCRKTMVPGRRLQWSTINWRYAAASPPTAAAAWLGQSSSHRSSLPEVTPHTFRTLHIIALRDDGPARSPMRCRGALQ